MSVRLRVLEYNLALVPSSTSGSETLNFASTDVEPALSSAFVTDEGARIVSPTDQISIVISPPTLGVVDHAGVPPVRKQIQRPVKTIVQILDAQGFDVAAFGWNLVGRVDGVTPSGAMRNLIDEQRIDSAISRRNDRGWFVPLIQLNAESDVADRITINLQAIPAKASPELGFAVNAHFERRLALDELLQSGDNVWAEVEGLLTLLVQ